MSERRGIQLSLPLWSDHKNVICGEELPRKGSNQMIRGIEHIGLCAADPVALAEWYCSKLGFGVVHAIEDRKTFFVRAQNGGMLEIYPAKTTTQPVDNLHTGLRHIAVAVTDVHLEISLLRAKGIEIPDALIVTTPEMTIAFFRDPEGNLLHLVERRKELP